MARSKWKFLFYSNDILNKAVQIKVKKKIKGKCRIIFKKSSSIPKTFLNYKFNIFKGFFFRSLTINKFFLGYKFGEFAFTRKPFKYIVKSKLKKNFVKR